MTSGEQVARKPVEVVRILKQLGIALPVPYIHHEKAETNQN